MFSVYLCVILAAIFIQLAMIKPTGPNMYVSKYDITRNVTEKMTIM